MKRSTLFLFLAACKGFGSFLGGEVSEPDYSEDAEENLRRGNDALDSKNYIEAQKYFDYVKSKYPYLEAATLAELRLGDVDFDREKYLEARDRYVNFAKLHPTHPKLDYAEYRAALTHYKDMPSDLFILPPSSEKDQGEVKAANIALSGFLRGFPNSEYAAPAQKALDEVRRRMAEHELYVANFYRRREKWDAVVLRLNVLARDFGNLGYEEKAYFGLYDAYRSIQADSRERIKQGTAELAKAKAAVERRGDKATDDDRLRVTEAERHIKDAEEALARAEGKPEESLTQLIAKYPDSAAASRAKRVLGQ